MSASENTDFDVVVLGAGSGGYAAALRAGQLGLSVALVEQDKLGGTCLHTGCIPTKALLHAAEVADSVTGAAAIGVRARLESIDVTALQAYQSGVVTKLHRGLEGLLDAAPGVTVVTGTGRLDGPRTVVVGDDRLTGRHLVLATGSRTRELPGLPVGGRVLSSTEALALPVVPGRVVVIGGSAIGAEFASAWRSLGAEVTIVEALPTLVPLEDPALSKHLSRAFRKRGIAQKTGVQVTAVEQDADGATVVLADGGRLEADYVLLAVGRVPVTDGLGLAEAGIETSNGWVVTDDRLAASVPGVHAVGDLVQGLQLAHRGFAHGIFVAEEIAGLDPQPVLDAHIPRVTYSSPEVASVGLTEAQARELYDDVEVVEQNLGGNGKSLILQTAGVVRMIRRTAGPVVGVHMIGDRIGEQVGEAALLVTGGRSPEDLARHVHAHPTQNEALGEALLSLAGKPLHSHA